MKRVMQGVLMMAVFAAGTALAADYEEIRDLSLNASGIASLSIEAGAGSLEIKGVPQSDTIVVKAIIQVQGERQEKASEIIESELVLSLEKDGEGAQLKGYFEDSGGLFGSPASVRLEVTLPERMSLFVEDGSGSMDIRNVAGDIEVNDGSGSIKMNRVGGKVTVDDGSGSFSAQGVGGDISIVDGSGSLSVENVDGSVEIDDGSGSISVTGVAGGLTVLNDGSGSLNVKAVEGPVDTGT